jgi:NAD(P)-dependent dehydrogenase (short-subunit alcohol dehydrogenase family)
MTMAVNHLSHFLLTQKILPLLRQSKTRVISVSSVAHGRGRLDWQNLMAEKTFDAYGVYALSKLANVFFAVELAQREKGSLTANSLHPGVINTKLLRTGFGMGGAPLKEGAKTSVFLATSPNVENTTGKYFSNSTQSQMNEIALEADSRRRFWEISEKWCSGF